MNKLTQTSLAVSLFLFACTPSTPSITSSQGPLQNTTQILPTKKTLQKLPVAFKIEPGFSTQTSVQASFVRLVIEGKDSNGDPQIIYAFGADNNGFVEVTGSTISLSAEVPEGEFWTVTGGFYSNTSEGGKIFERMAAFSTVGRTGDSPPVEINALSHPVGKVIKELYTLNSNAFIFGLTINGLQGFVNGLIGAPTLSRLNELDNQNNPIPDSPKDTFDLNTNKLANEINQGLVSPSSLNETLGISFDPRDYRHAPYLQTSYSLEPFTDGLRETLALNKSSGNLYFSDVRGTGTGGQTIGSDEVLYGVNYANNAFNELFKVSVGNIKSIYLSLGLANNTGSETKEAIYLTREKNDGLELVALNQTDGSEIWTFDFNGLGTHSLPADFTPVAFREQIQPGQSDCGCAIDDFDYVYVAFNFSNSFASPFDASDTTNNGTGIYKLYSVGDSALGASSPFGTSRLAGFYAYPGDAQGEGKDAARFRSTGALNQDGSRLYVVSEGDFFNAPPELIVINTSDMSQVAKVDLTPYKVRTKSAPVIGADGTVYLAVFGDGGSNAGSFLKAFNPDGSDKWMLTLDNNDSFEPDYPPVVDYVSGKNQIYVHVNGNGKVLSVQDNGTSGSISWEHTVGVELRSSPLLAEYYTSKYLYLGTTETGQTIGLNASNGQEIWSTTTDGSFASGFNFFDDHLFVATKDGNDHSDIRIRAVKVNAQRISPTTPWPKFGGSENNAGHVNYTTP